MERTVEPEMRIDSKEEFYSTLQDLYCTEDCFEGMHSWVGTVLSERKYKDILSELADDSSEHKKKLKELFSKMEGLEPKEEDIESFDFEEGGDDEAILKTVLENDYSALYHYSLLKVTVDKELLTKMLDEEDVQDYYETLEYLIEEELRHIKMLRSELD